MAGMWARLQADLNVKLRRGAWYRITRLDPLKAVLEVGGRPPRDSLRVFCRLSSGRPAGGPWSLGRPTLCTFPRAGAIATPSARAVVSGNRSPDGRGA